MQFTQPYKNIIHALADSKQELNRAFVRLQEFYEAPYPEIRGHKFTLAQFKPIYAADHGGKFTYYGDWAGNNIPGNVVKEFFSLYDDSELSEYEKEIKKYLKNLLNSKKKFYLIASAKGTKSSFYHEVAHAMYYMNSGYKKRCNAILKKLDKNFYAAMIKWLAKSGYTEQVFLDETQAYLSESSMLFISNRIGINYKKVPWNQVFELKQNYANTIKRLQKPA